MRETRTGREGNVDLIKLTTLSDAKALISRKAITEASNVHWRRQIFESLDALDQHLISSTDGAREWLNSIPRWPQSELGPSALAIVKSLATGIVTRACSGRIPKTTAVAQRMI